ncbi:hypothetical protein ACI3L1_18155 [Deinococcus sp. SM5_A1]|uniref:hypothetical protein n=1 Tax=Deinococcus sp. SM5_A1 TaxID=3379094 RepID=UPI0038586DBD
MKNNLLKLALLGTFALASGAFAATSTGTLATSGTAPAATVSVFLVDTAGTTAVSSLDLGTLNNTTYTYGSGTFKIKMTYANVATSVSLALSRTETTPDTTYTLAYKFTPEAAGTPGTPVSDVAFGTSIGTFTTTGTVTDNFAKGSGTAAFNSVSAAANDGTIFAIGAKSSTASYTALSATVTLTATAN